MKLWKQCLWILAQAACTFAMAQPPVSAHEAEYAQAAAAYQKQDFATVIRLLQPLAEQGDATAQHNLAVLYQDGLGVPASAEKALYWYEKAAEQGQAEAQFMAGLMYSDGIGTAQDYQKAAQWYEKAAQKGHAEAQNNLAARYATGTGVTRDMAKAKYWYGKAAAQGNKQAAYTLQQLEALEKNNGSLKTQMLNEAQKTLLNKK